jgi:hypothetical protein
MFMSARVDRESGVAEHSGLSRFPSEFLMSRNDGLQINIGSSKKNYHEMADDTSRKVRSKESKLSSKGDCKKSEVER